MAHRAADNVTPRQTERARGCEVCLGCGDHHRRLAS